MLRLNRFNYLAPSSIDEAVQLLAEYGADASLMAGGTDVLVNIKQRLATPRYLVSVRQLAELRGVQEEAGWLTLRAGTPLSEVESSPVVESRYPALAEAARLISTPQVRAIGTIGGNVCLDVRCNYYNQSYEWRKAIGFCMKRDSEICRLAPGGDRCWAVASADTVPVLIALGAETSITGPAGSRRVPLESLYRDDGLVPLGLSPAEIVTAIHLPPAAGTCVYRKYRMRHSFDFPLVGIAVWMGVHDGIVEDARVVMTAVASYPDRAERAEDVLRGQPLTEEIIAEAGLSIFRRAKPMDNTSGTIFHRKRMARVLFERAARQIAGIDEPVRRTA